MSVTDTKEFIRMETAADKLGVDQVKLVRMERGIPKKALGLRQSEKDIWTHKGYYPKLHEVGNLWQLQEHCTSVDGESRVDSA